MKNKFCARLRELRGKDTQAVFANKIGLRQQTYARWENGERKPNILELTELTTRFGVSADWILGILDDKQATIKEHPPPDKDRQIENLIELAKSQQETISILVAPKKGDTATATSAAHR